MVTSKPQLSDKFHPSKSFSFPKRTFGKVVRSVWAVLYESFLGYTTTLYTEHDAAFCHLCMATEHEKKIPC